MTDQEIITLLTDDPERGMEQLVEQCTGLLWSIAGRLLQEPEDIKDCVNETFAEFFWQRERFDPSRGGLRGYLAMIAHRLAIKKYQENHRFADGEPVDVEAGDLFLQFERREEIDSYLRALAPVDEQIVRMKYYGGMTAKEIAASLKLPYETVKKRHQRSLKKLLKAMTIGLIITLLAAILAACAYVVLCYFGIVPGYGVNTDPGGGVYVMEEETIAVQSEDFDLTITDVWWMNGLLTVDGIVTLPGGEDLGTGFAGAEPPAYNELTVVGLEDAGKGVDVWSQTDNPLLENVRMIWKGQLPKGTRNALTLDLNWENGTSCTLTLNKVGNELSYEQVGYFDLTEDEGGLLAVPRLENGELIVAVYPLNEGDYEILPMLTNGPYTSFETECRDITVTAADGTVLTGKMVRGGSFSNNSYYEWNFGTAGPGEYVLEVPFVYQTSASGTAGDVVVRDVPLEPEDCELDITFPFKGGEIYLTREMPVTDYVYAISADTEEVRAMNQQYAHFRWWDIDTDWTSADPERTIAGYGLQVLNDSGEVLVEVNGSTIGIPKVMSQSRTEPLPGSDALRLLGLRIGAYSGDTARLLLDPQSVGYRWNREFLIHFEVAETE